MKLFLCVVLISWLCNFGSAMTLRRDMASGDVKKLSGERLLRLPRQAPQTSGQDLNNVQPNTVQSCLQSCLVTAEYNPVCGTDNVTYSNPGRLACAQNCGTSTDMRRRGPCPAATTVAPSAAN